MLRTEFYAAFAPDDDRGTVRYHDQRHRGLHQAAFTYEEWQQIRAVTESMARKPQQQSAARRFYEFAGYLADIHCGLTLRAQGKSTTTDYEYYRDTARARRIPCPTGGHLMLRSDLVRAQFGDMLKSLELPDNWREEIRRQMLAEAQSQGNLLESMEKEKERLKLKRSRILKQHREGYIDDDEFHGEIAAVELALHQLQTPEVNGVKFGDVIQAGEHIPGMAALWDEATPDERRDMVMLLLEPGGLYYDLELKIIAALKPRPAFLPILRMLKGIVEYDEARGLIVTENWQERNRRASNHRSHLARIPLEKLFSGRRGDLLVYQEHTATSSPRADPFTSALDHPRLLSLSGHPQAVPDPRWKIPPSEWGTVLQRVEQGEPLRRIARDYGVSYEAVRRVLRAARRR